MKIIAEKRQMPLNLLKDRWIPVSHKTRGNISIAPWEISDPLIGSVQWGRADLDASCLEMLVGILFLACPPADEARRQEMGRSIDADFLKAAFVPYEAAFNLVGEGPLFMQEPSISGEPRHLDGLFLNGAGAQTIRNNVDLAVHRNRYDSLSLAQAAMTLYTLQTSAPAGGRGNRTSLRGGGPMTTLLEVSGEDDRPCLWETLWLNVPYGRPADVGLLPWMRDVPMTSENDEVHYPPAGAEGDSPLFDAEAFFSMPRRLKLVLDEEGERVTGFIQKPYGINYGRWEHPLTPYYQSKKAGEGKLPCHIHSAGFSFLYGSGILFADKAADEENSSPALIVREYLAGQRGPVNGRLNVSLRVSGWSMSNMAAINYESSSAPICQMDKEKQDFAGVLVSFLGFGLNFLKGSSIPDVDAIIDDVKREMKSDFAHVLEQMHYLPNLGEDSRKEIAQYWVDCVKKKIGTVFHDYRKNLPDLVVQHGKMAQDFIKNHEMFNIFIRGFWPKGDFYERMGLASPVVKKETRKRGRPAKKGKVA